MVSYTKFAYIINFYPFYCFTLLFFTISHLKISQLYMLCLSLSVFKSFHFECLIIIPIHVLIILRPVLKCLPLFLCPVYFPRFIRVHLDVYLSILISIRELKFINVRRLHGTLDQYGMFMYNCVLTYASINRSTQ